MITCMNFVSFNQQLSDLVMYMYVYSLQVLSAVETPSGLFPRLVEPWAPLFSIPDFAGSRRPACTACRKVLRSSGRRFQRRLGFFQGLSGRRSRGERAGVPLMIVLSTQSDFRNLNRYSFQGNSSWFLISRRKLLPL